MGSKCRSDITRTRPAIAGAGAACWPLAGPQRYSAAATATPHRRAAERRARNVSNTASSLRRAERLFDRVGPSLGHLAILLRGPAAGTDRADDFSARDERKPTLERRSIAQPQDGCAAAGERILEDLAGPPEQGGGAGLVYGDLDRPQLSVVHSLEVDQEPAGVDDRNGIWRGADFFDLLDGCRCRLLGVVEADRCAIGHRRRSGGRRGSLGSGLTGA